MPGGLQDPELNVIYEPVREMIKDEDDTQVFQTLLEAATARFNRRNPKEEPIDDTKFRQIVADRGILAWHDVKNAIMDKKDELIKAILETEIPLFDLSKRVSTKDNARL